MAASPMSQLDFDDESKLNLQQAKKRAEEKAHRIVTQIKLRAEREISETIVQIRQEHAMSEIKHVFSRNNLKKE